MAVFESSNISETGKATPTKIGVYACYINPYLHEFLKLILINKIFCSWTVVHGPKGKIGRF